LSRGVLKTENHLRFVTVVMCAAEQECQIGGVCELGYILFRKSERKRLPVRPSRGLEDNIKMRLEEMGCGLNSSVGIRPIGELV